MVGTVRIEEAAAVGRVVARGNKATVGEGHGSVALMNEHPGGKIERLAFQHVRLKIDAASAASVRALKGAGRFPISLSEIDVSIYRVQGLYDFLNPRAAHNIAFDHDLDSCGAQYSATGGREAIWPSLPGIEEMPILGRTHRENGGLYMKKLTQAALIAVAALALVGITGCAKKAPETRLDAIKKAGKLILGTSADYPPYEFHVQKDGKDTIVGFDIAIAEEIAKDLGVTLEIKDMDFDGLLAALTSGNVDLIISGMTPTEERKQNVDFSDIYYFAEHGVMIRKADLDKYGSDVASLKDAVIGAQRGAIQVKLAKTRIKGVADDKAEEPNEQVKELGKLPDLVMELKNAKVEAVVAELPVAKAYLGANDDLTLASYTFKDDDGGSAVAVKKGETALAAEINKTVARLVSEGKIDQFVTAASESVEY
jgi:polar amino acid transport system substrate-binding protein